MADDIDEEAGFPDEEIQQTLETAVINTLENAMWDESKVPQQINDIIEKTMKLLNDLKLPYKYIVNCMLIQKTDRPLVSTFSTYMENNIDGTVTYIYPPLRSKESAPKTIQCFASVTCMRF